MHTKRSDRTLRAEEMARYFINQAPQKSFNKNFKMINMKNYCTLRDSLNLTDSDSSLSTKTVSQVNNNEQTISIHHNKKNSIQINKDIIKFAEPRFKVPTSIKVPQKFSSGANSLLTSSMSFKHEITETETDLLEIDEKLPQNKFDLIEAKRSFVIQKNFNFALLVEIEKKYEDLLKDLKGNGIDNIIYKEKVSAEYFSLIVSDDNIMGDIFNYNKDVNKFLIRELCIFLIMMFIGDCRKVTENELIDFKTCLSYSHLNFLFVVMTIVNKYKENIDKFDSLKTDVCYEKCNTLLELNSNRIDSKKYQSNFHSQNKIIKTVISNLLFNLKEDNPKLESIIELFTTKNKKFNDAKREIQLNDTILNKVKEIIDKNTQIENSENLSEDEDEEEKLPQPDPPFLKPKRSDDPREYTLVLDLDETLVHYFQDEKEESAYVKVRMGTENFIMTLSKYCEIVIFTASTEYYANIVIDGLDSKDKIDYRLYRQHTTYTDGVHIKDLSKLGREESKMIIVDNIEDNYQLQPRNGLNISDFEGDENDSELNYLLEDLLKVVRNKGVDVREFLPEIRKKMQMRYTNIY